MSLISHAVPDDFIGEVGNLPAIVLISTVLLVGALAFVTGNLDMGHSVAGLLIGP